MVIAAGHDVETAGFARVQSFSVEACDGDQQCAAVPVTFMTTHLPMISI